MKKITLFSLLVILSYYLIACSKSNSSTPQSPYQSLILGKWLYAHANNYDSVFITHYATHTQLLHPHSTYNYLIFTDSNIAYSMQYAWGSGMTTVIYNDTVSYKIAGNNIFLLWPAGTNMYAAPTFTYPAYQDTITIKSLTQNTFTLTRNYHYKHFITNTGEVKVSIDSLMR